MGNHVLARVQLAVGYAVTESSSRTGDEAAVLFLLDPMDSNGEKRSSAVVHPADLSGTSPSKGR